MADRLTMLAIHPGPPNSTADVYRGLVLALRELGHTVYHYPLDRALTLAHEVQRAAKRKGFITQMDMDGLQYMAGVLALDRALHYNVEWVLIVAGQLFHPDFQVKLKFAGRKIALVLTESPYEFEREWERCKFADVVFTSERRTAAILQRVHPSAHYLPHAYDPSLHRPDPPADAPPVPAHDVVFVGTAWPERVALLEAVDWDGIDFGLYGINWRGRLRRRSPLRRHLIEGLVPNPQTAALYRQAKIGLNLHRTSQGHGPGGPHIQLGQAESMNPRAYELAACGLFSLSDARAEVVERFGDLVPTFRDAAELESLLRAYLADPRGRASRAAQLPAVVAADTFTARAATVAAALAGCPSTVHAVVAEEVVPV